MTGGSSRVDVQSLSILRPFSVAACGVAAVTLRRDHIRGNEWLLVGIGLMFMLAALHIAPLPTALWQALPGREIITQIDGLTGLRDVSRPLTFSPITGWEALMSLFAPLAIVLFGIQLGRDELYRLLPLFIGLGALSGLLGILQVIGSSESPLYLYKITNDGSAVGLFANRNHAAVFLACLFPMVAAYASTADTEQQSYRRLVTIALAICLVPLILVTGSRSGLLIAVIGFLGGALLYSSPTATDRKVRQKSMRLKLANPLLLVGLAVACLVFVTIFFSRAQAIDRMFSDSNTQDYRSLYWVESLGLFSEHFPWGTGSGSFVEAFRAAEPATLLSSAYVNRVHNDWIELALVFGLPGLVLLAMVVFFFLHRAAGLARRDGGKRRSTIIGRMGAIVIVMIAVASIFDYPLRTPAMMCMFMILTLWFVGPVKGTSRAGTPSAHLDPA